MNTVPFDATFAGSLATLLLLSLRVATTLFMTPLFYGVPMPASMRALLLAALSIALASGLAQPPFAWSGWESFTTSALRELALGATFGLGVLVAFGAFAVAGQVLDLQLGFGMAQLVDPLTQRPVPILTSAFQMLAILVFFLVDGHHALLRGIGWSVDVFPVGAVWSVGDAAAPVLRHVAGLLTLGLALIAPVAFCILLVEFVLGVIARNLPQMNMFALGIPVKIVAGLLALSLWFAGIGPVMIRLYASIAMTWQDIFATAPAATQGAPGAPRTR